MRADYFEFDVNSDLAANSGRADDSIVSPKLGITLGPWNETELFVNYGRGFHSNDARGTTIRVDPVDQVTPMESVDPLVAATGAELGLRTAALPGLQLAMSAWTLTLDSELLFVGDGGTTEASPKSRRRGVELGAFWTPLDWLSVDLDLAWSQARFAGDDPAGDQLSVFNLFDDDGNDITYFYESRLPDEATSVEDVHFHPVEPRTLRATVSWRF